jgi:DNA helicase-2/ATP-dependent DNA helicase PcrA
MNADRTLVPTNAPAVLPPYLASLNEEQLKATLHGTGPAMVLAGAGSGKTRVLTSRVAYLILEKHIDPNAILLVTFTNKAAAEMTERVVKLTGKRPQFSGTFHRLCAKILRVDGHYIGISPAYVIYDDDDQLSIVKSLLKNFHYSSKEFNPRMILSMISQAKNELMDPKSYEAVARGKYQLVASRVFTAYEKKLAANNAVDFDNLLNKSVELFQTYPQVLQKYQLQFEYVLVDEYQDVNKAQYLLTKLLAAPQNNLFCVGDFSQSIYAWRGADYRNMLALKKDYPGIAEYKLERNYRSTQTILDAATAVIANNTTHPVLSLWTDKSSATDITLFEAETDKDEVEFVVRNIRKMEGDYPLNEFVVLYRTNAQSRGFEDAFIRNGIPYRLVGGVRFYARKEVKDLLAYLRVFTNEKDEVSLERIEKLGKRRLAVFMDWLNKTTIFPETPLEILDTIIEASGYKSLYDPKLEEDVERLENIQELRSVASEFTSLSEFLENVALVESDVLPETRSTVAAQPAVSLMSMHAAKGLEFGVVFIVGMEEGLFPHSRSLMDKNELEEERRLCYVGITRAKDLLYLTYTRRRLLYGNITGSIVSRFVTEIPDHLLARQGMRDSFQPGSTSRIHYTSLDDSSLTDVLNGDIDAETFLDL